MSSEDEDSSNSSVYVQPAGDLRKTVNNSELSDITFVCEDGVEVHACRMLLAARSSVFRQMLLNGMGESRDSIVKLPTVTSSVLIIVLRFLYVGKLSEEDLYLSMAPINGNGGAETSSDDQSESLRLDWSLLVKVVSAARFLMLDTLEEVILDKMGSELLGERCHTEDSLSRNASLLSVLWTGGGEVKSVEAVCTSIVSSLMSHDLSLPTLFMMSEEAFRYYLTESRTVSRDRYCEWSLDEYLRLRQLLAWCAIRNNHGLGGPGNLDLTCLPGPDAAIQFLEANEENEEFNLDLEFDFSPGRTYLLNNVAKESMKPLLDMVDLVSVHPDLMCNVIQPLNIIEPIEFSNILGAQAVRVARMVRNLKHRITSCWHLQFCSTGTHTELGRVQDNHYCTVTPSKRDEVIYLRVAAFFSFLQNPMGRFTDYKSGWEFVAIPHGSVGICSMSGLEFGFCRETEGTFYSKPLGTLPLSEDPRAVVVKINRDLRSAGIHHDHRIHDWELPLGKQFEWKKPLRMRLEKSPRRSFDRVLFSYAGDTFSLSVRETSCGYRYPAIDFRVETLDGTTFRPHYDQLTATIQMFSTRDI